MLPRRLRLEKVLHPNSTPRRRWNGIGRPQRTEMSRGHTTSEAFFYSAPRESLKILTVKPNQSEGLKWTFMAATNRHPYACWNMGKALRAGLGTSVNLVAAYAWLGLFSETSPGMVVGRGEMNRLALVMDTSSLREGQNLLAQFKAGHWQAPVIRAIPEGDPRLKLNGITFDPKNPLAVINGKTFSAGESAKVPVKPGTLSIQCLKIDRDSVLVSVEGEDAPRVLRLK